MDRVLRLSIGLVVVFASLACGDIPTESASSVQRVQPTPASHLVQNVYRAIDRQDSWLSNSPNGPFWREFLKTSELRQVLAEPNVDRKILASVLGRYNSKVAGLDQGPFVSTRRALTELADQVRVPLSLRWAEEVRSAAPFQKRFSKQAIRDAKYKLIDAKAALDVFLSHADTETRLGWKTFLKSRLLEEQLQADQPDWEKIDEVLIQYSNGHRGLEYPAFVRVRKALQSYSFVGKLSETEKSKEALEQYYSALADALEKYNAEPTTKSAGRVASLLDWLSRIDRDSNLSKAVRSHHALPNIHLRVAEDLLQRRFQREVNDTTGVNEMILQTHVRGTATTVGRVTADVVHNPYVAQIDLVFDGVTHTVSLGRQRSVSIRSQSQTNLQARKPLFIYPSKLASQPARAAGSTSTHIQSITPDRKLGRKLVEKIAWKRANEQKPQTEAIAAYRAARRLEGKIDDQTADLLTRAGDALRRQLDGPLSQRGLFPDSVHTHSDDNAVHVHATQAGEGQLAATTAPPHRPLGTSVIAEIHESAINNTAERAIAGLKLTDEQIVELLKRMDLEVPPELEISEDNPAWSITFDWNQPVTVRFEDQQLTISLRGREFTRGDRTLNKVMEISATYDMKTLPQGVVLTRSGDVEVSFPGREGARLGASDLLFTTLMEKKFGQLFKPVIEGNGFTLPGRFSELGVIRLHSLSTDDSWLSLGWNY